MLPIKPSTMNLFATRCAATLPHPTTPLGKMLNALAGKSVDLRKNPINKEHWDTQALMTALKAMEFQGIPNQLILPKGEVLYQEKEWALQLMNTLNKQRKAVLNYILSSNDKQDKLRCYISNNEQGLKNLSTILNANKIADNILLCNIDITDPSTKEALAEVMSNPHVNFHKLETTGAPITLYRELLKSNPAPELEDLLKK